MKNNTFHYKDLLIETHNNVYDPAEDTFLLLEVINVKKDDFVLEIGTGCGIIALECAKLGANVVCTDINPLAVELTKCNYLRNELLLNGNFEVRIGDLFSPVYSYELFDVIIFNPPYLPTKKGERIGGWLDAATDGGKSGLDTTKKFIEMVPKFLKDKGKAYFVFSSLADKNKLEHLIKKNKLYHEIILSKKYDDEILYVYLLKK